MTHEGKRLQMLDPDIQGVLQSLERDHLIALLDYMLGDVDAAEMERACASLFSSQTEALPSTTKAPDINRGQS
jgi:hypothetical protein